MKESEEKLGFSDRDRAIDSFNNLLDLKISFKIPNSS